MSEYWTFWSWNECYRLSIPDTWWGVVQESWLWWWWREEWRGPDQDVLRGSIVGQLDNIREWTWRTYPECKELVRERNRWRTTPGRELVFVCHWTSTEDHTLKKIKQHDNTQNTIPVFSVDLGRDLTTKLMFATFLFSPWIDAAIALWSKPFRYIGFKKSLGRLWLDNCKYKKHKIALCDRWE